MRLSTHQGHDRLIAVRRLSVDMLIWVTAFFVGTGIRFFGNPQQFQDALYNYAPGVVISVCALLAMAYILGLYSVGGVRIRLRRRILLITCCLFVATVVMLALGSVNFSWKIGRGVLLLSGIPATFLIWLHHWVIHRLSYLISDSAVVLVASEEDELDALLLSTMELRGCKLLGCYVREGYQLRSDIKCLGTLGDVLNHHDDEESIDRVYCAASSLKNDDVAYLLRRLRYSGVAISSTPQACEEVYQAIPLDLIDNEWLLHACGQPNHVYIAKLKRLADILASLTVGVLSSPLLLLGIFLVWCRGGKGPIFFRQQRLGRFGRTFELIKLRTMSADAEANGAQWSTDNDPRVTKVGHFLRKFRIDELPQLWNILRGDMSFVGPRPEREEFLDELSGVIPYFSERMLVHPGLTGWAQISYPYGNTVEDSRRKLEFDLYYIKNMGLVLDFFVLLDTIKIVIKGGACRTRGDKLAAFEDRLLEAQRKMGPRCQSSLRNVS